MSFPKQSKWKSLKYEIRKKCASFKKFLTQKSGEQHADLLCKITTLEEDTDSKEKFEEYDKTKNMKKYTIKLGV